MERLSGRFSVTRWANHHQARSSNACVNSTHVAARWIYVVSMKTGYDSRDVMGARRMLKNSRMARMFPRLSLAGLTPRKRP